MKFAKSRNKGLQSNQLAACPNSPNCVVSENADDAHTIEPLAFYDNPQEAWLRVKNAIKKNGGKIQAVDDTYLWATFTSKIMRYVDDVELRLDEVSQCIHLRSVSRVGYSDLGANRRRMEALRKEFSK